MDTASICRCKLYYLCDDEWKEQGTGYPIIDEEKLGQVIIVKLLFKLQFKFILKFIDEQSHKALYQ